MSANKTPNVILVYADDLGYGIYPAMAVWEYKPPMWTGFWRTV